ncbi:MAG: hypothetical protein HY731_13695 [Candidatus Tectomicrobia bacterium]|nr:hypothetical protein [Candidatus Tectomicrobia bacterium]
MSRVLLVRSSEGNWEIDYSKLSLEEIERRIKAYEQRHGDFQIFFANYDCDTSGPEDYLTLVDWENLLIELKRKAAT